QRRRRGEEVPRCRVLEGETVERLVAEDHQRVLTHRFAGADVHAVEIWNQLADLRARRRPAEEVGDALFRHHLADQDLLPAPRRGQRNRRGDRALARATLACHHDQAAIEEGWHGARDCSVRPQVRQPALTWCGTTVDWPHTRPKDALMLRDNDVLKKMIATGEE